LDIREKKTLYLMVRCITGSVIVLLRDGSKPVFTFFEHIKLKIHTVTIVNMYFVLQFRQFK